MTVRIVPLYSDVPLCFLNSRVAVGTIVMVRIVPLYSDVPLCFLNSRVAVGTIVVVHTATL